MGIVDHTVPGAPSLRHGGGLGSILKGWRGLARKTIGAGTQGTSGVTGIMAAV
jgi:hypothetical protein